MFCARCGRQLSEPVQLCPFCGQQATLASIATPPPPSGNPAAAPAVSYATSLSWQAPAAMGGVQGWLLFFCICLTIVWPLLALMSIATLLATHYPLSRLFPPVAILGWIRVALGTVAGIAAWQKNSATMPLLRVYYGMGVLLYLYNVSTQRVVRPSFSVVTAALLLRYGLPFALLAAGVSYFSLSQRVRATYGGTLLSFS